jgi:predicted GIY-YIG superfamily endonuclease
MYYVYKIEINKVTRYIGYTGDIESRNKQHNYLCFKKMKSKILYNNIRKLYPSLKKINLSVVKVFSTKLEAKRFECFLILHDHFSKKELWQRIPRITDV